MKDLKDFLGHAKGKLLEHVVYKWIRESLRLKSAICDIMVNGEQVDCMGEIGSSISVFECKLNIHQDEIDYTIERISDKSKAVAQDHRAVKPWLIVYGRIPAARRLAFETRGIFVLDNFRDVIQHERCFDGTRKETLGILDWEFERSQIR